MIATVTYPIKEDSILLGRKMNKVGAGMLNGFGGKPEEGDISLLHTASRELYEETGFGIAVHPLDLKVYARIKFYFYNSENPEWEVVFFLAPKFTGEAKSTTEMSDPTWYKISELETLYDEMLPADKKILTRIIRGEKFVGHVRFSEDKKSCTELEFNSVNNESQILI
ncbi:MAG: 8-oxo-dGTP diphosphatase [Patescibacteria group bacterium]|nr:8-oxo-dGTP diphosphatase [Patescibacteria group bacterium]MDQ5953062.1 8-oxo-dGTP diphosphatase [Patescibacteria group bacterium]